MAKIEPRLFT